MTTAAHIISASFVATTVAHVAPTETSYMIASAAAAGLIDLDHLILIYLHRSEFKRTGYKGQLHKARSIFHELAGYLAVALTTLVINIYNSKMALVIFLSFAIHLVEDMIIGKSYPFNPIDKTEIRLFDLSLKKKAIIDISTIILFSFLWITFLRG